MHGTTLAVLGGGGQLRGNMRAPPRPPPVATCHAPALHPGSNRGVPLLVAHGPDNARARAGEQACGNSCARQFYSESVRSERLAMPPETDNTHTHTHNWRQLPRAPPLDVRVSPVAYMLLLAVKERNLRSIRNMAGQSNVWRSRNRTGGLTCRSEAAAPTTRLRRQSVTICSSATLYGRSPLHYNLG